MFLPRGVEPVLATSCCVIPPPFPSSHP